MSTVTRVLPQSFTAEGQIINIVTPSVAIAQSGQDATTVNLSEPVQLVTPVFTVPNIQPSQCDPAVETDKHDIYQHPLFPLMALMFEKCEQASSVSDMPSPESINDDMQVFLLHKEKEKKGLLSGDTELDNLMIKAIQVLRIHLLELEKVNELCKDFCQRYTSCLKGKLQSENLLRTESDYDQSMFDEPPKEEAIQSLPTMTSTSPGGGVILQQPFQSSVPTMPALGPGQIMSGGTIYQMVQTAQGLVAQPLQLQQNITSLATPLIHGSTPLSQIGVPATQNLVSTTANSSSAASFGSISSGFDSDDDDNGKKKSKRGVLPKSATQIMKSWLFQHIVHPYPTEDEKRQIAGQTNLTLLQVNNWFINARRRILQPMLDAGNPEQSKSKKAKPQSKPPQRFWPFGTSQNTTSLNTDSVTVTAPSTSSLEGASPTFVFHPGGASKTIVIPHGSFFASDGQILNLPATNMAAMLNHIKQTSPSPPPDTMETKDSSDTNNNSHNTDNESVENDDINNTSHTTDEDADTHIMNS